MSDLKQSKRNGWTRRDLMGGSLAALVTPWTSAQARATGSSFSLDLLREPDLVRAVSGQAPAMQILRPAGGKWAGDGILVEVERGAQESVFWISASDVPMHRVHLRWKHAMAQALVLGDAWERSYGDLAWLPLQPERVLPWYFLVEAGGRAAGAGVKVGGGAFAFWQVDQEGVSLWFDVRCGGDAVHLGPRRLHAGTVVQQVVQQSSHAHEDAWSTARALCKAMAKDAPPASHRGIYDMKAIYGSNDWYYAYGNNTPAGILRDAALVRELIPSGGPRAFTVIDDGYQNVSIFPDMHRLAEDVRGEGVSPGVWIRPLRASASDPANLLLPSRRSTNPTGELAFDPTIPDARERILKTVTQACDWGYDFIKHDFTTYELLGQWGSTMGASPARGGWSFHDRTRTSAEIVRALYQDIRTAAGDDRVILGCNTIGHLAVGLFDIQRTGDDVSGRSWERTRRMGVNTLAFRLAQNGVFFATDPDCVPLTPDIPWKLTEAWLEAVAGSGSALFISPDPRAVGTAQGLALKRAFKEVTLRPVSRPLDWTESRTPARWQTGDGAREFEWLEPSGASPFSA